MSTSSAAGPIEGGMISMPIVSADLQVARWHTPSNTGEPHNSLNKKRSDKPYETFQSNDTFCRPFDNHAVDRCLRGLVGGHACGRHERHTTETRSRATLVRDAGGGHKSLAGGHRSQRQGGPGRDFRPADP